MSLLDSNDRTTRLFIAGGLLILAGGALGGGCGGADYTRVQDFCQALAKVDCSNAVVQACWGASDATLDTDTQACIAARSPMEKCDPDRLPYHAEFAQGCIDAHEAAFSNTQIDAPTLQMVTQACLPVFNNGGTTGASCASDADCAVGSGYACITHQGSKGSCQVPVAVDNGLSCSSTAAQCGEGFYCNGNCVSDPGKGGKCGPGVSCSAGFRCDPMSLVCANQLKDGSGCLAGSDCVGGFCIGGQCAATYTLAFGSSTCKDFTNGTN